MKSGSSSSYRAALSGTGADFGGERDDPEPAETDLGNLYAHLRRFIEHGQCHAQTAEDRKRLDDARWKIGAAAQSILEYLKGRGLA